MSVYMDVHTSICAHMCEMSINIYLFMCACLHANGYVCNTICLCACVYIYVCMCSYVYICNMWMIIVCGCIDAFTYKYM